MKMMCQDCDHAEIFYRQFRWRDVLRTAPTGIVEQVPDTVWCNVTGEYIGEVTGIRKKGQYGYEVELQGGRKKCTNRTISN